MEAKEVIQFAETLNYEQLSSLAGRLKDMARDKFRDTYHVVEVHNYQGCITHLIKKAFPTFTISYRASSQNGIGTNLVIIPKDMIDEELTLRDITHDIKDQFDSFYKDFS